MVFDAVFLSRIQFAGSIVRHFLLPTLTIGHVSFIDIYTAWSCGVFPTGVGRMSHIIEARRLFAKAARRQHSRQYMDFHKLQPCSGAIRVRQRFASADFRSKSKTKG
ncbi:hypothetical protein LJR251_003472 [Rhizobium rhizogenes]|uniref:hypothetical protein n=1 Tax=Rhizobium rhizogenes TaxID=359 RepID=UPI003ECF57B5